MSGRRTSADGRFQRVAPSERRGLAHGRWIAAAAIAVLLGAVALIGSGGWMSVRAEKQAVGELEADLAVIEAERAEVEQRTEALMEPGGFELERLAREEYLMRAEGDRVIHLVDPGEEDEDGSSGSLDSPAPRS